MALITTADLRTAAWVAARPLTASERLALLGRRYEVDAHGDDFAATVLRVVGC